MNTDLQPYRTEIRVLMRAAINAQLAQERLEIVSDLETLQRSCLGSDQAVLAIVGSIPKLSISVPGNGEACLIQGPSNKGWA